MKKLAIFGIPVGAVAIALAVILAFSSMSQIGFSVLRVYAAGTPDEFGNYIYSVDIWQGPVGSTYDSSTFTSVFTKVAQITSSDYTEGQTITINSQNSTVIIVVVYLNKTLASDVNDAVSKTKVIMNITSICTNFELYALSWSSLTDYYKIEYSNVDDSHGDNVYTFSADQSYTVEIEYQAYY